MRSKAGAGVMSSASLAAQVFDIARGMGVREVEAIVTSSDQALTRFANNGIHQNVAERTSQLSVRALIDGRTARATTNRLDADGVRRVVEEAIAITRVQERDPDLLPLVEPARYAEVNRWVAETAACSPEERARAVAEAIAVVREAGQTAAGIYSTDASSLGIYNTRGVAAEYSETLARFSITAMAADSSGWAKASACDHRHLDAVALARSAAEKAARSAKPRELEPGRYTVILEAPAVLDLVGQMFGDFGATAIRDGRSFLNDRIGQKLFGDNIDIDDDVTHPLQAGAPFDGEGVPRQRLKLVERGVVREIADARKTGHGFPLPNEYGEAPANIVIAGGRTSVEEMIRSTARGVLVTRLWYIREVDPYEKIFTGMTRDGTFLVEDGEVVCGLKNFRFNQGLLEMLSNVEAMSPAVRSSGEEATDLVAPAMKVAAFNFTEVTKF